MRSAQCELNVESAVSAPATRDRASEDRWHKTTCSAWVLDGATVLDPHSDAVGMDATWFVEQVSRGLESVHDRREARSQLRASLASVRDANPREWQVALSLPYEQQPTCACAIAVSTGPTLSWASVGDCTVALLDSQGEVSVFRDPALGLSDAPAVEAMRSYLAEHPSATITEARSHARAELMHGRGMANAEDGFAVLTLDGAGVDRGCAGSVPVEEVRAVLLASDGFTRAVDLFRVADWESLLKGELDLGETVEKLREQEAADERCARYPRTKIHDDATAVLLSVCAREVQETDDHEEND